MAGWYPVAQVLDDRPPEGPFCECDSFACNRALPTKAWEYMRAGQAVVCPGHESPGEEFVLLGGFAVVRDDSQ